MSPILRQVLNNQEGITEATIRFTTPTPSGVIVEYYTVKLTNACIVSMKTVMANIRNPDLSKFPMYEEIAFTNQRADWKWIEGQITTSEASGSATVR